MGYSRCRAIHGIHARTSMMMCNDNHVPSGISMNGVNLSACDQSKHVALVQHDIWHADWRASYVPMHGLFTLAYHICDRIAQHQAHPFYH